ncbi:MAG: hypothetical protein ABSH22_01660 [Tepidisphaeraceae bacterium]
MPLVSFHLALISALADAGVGSGITLNWYTNPVFILPALLVIALLVFGLGDLAHFSLSRAWAIGGVCFRESIRRRVLWVIPIAVIGVIVVSQLERSVDEQDVIRQTTKFCIFAAGLVVVMTSIILACTNLPKEIETKVIYSIVTKPITRLEIVAGKIIGFARVSAVILLIMGLFTFGYLWLRDWRQSQEVTDRLQSDSTVTPLERNRLEHYQKVGLLSAASYIYPSDVQVMGEPARESDPVRTTYGDMQEEFLFPYSGNNKNVLFADPANPGTADAASGIGRTGALIGLRLKWQRYGTDNAATANAKPGDAIPAYVQVDILDSNQTTLVNRMAMYDPLRPGAKDAHTDRLPLPIENTLMSGKAIADSKLIWAYVPPAQAATLFAQPIVYVHVVGIDRYVEFYADPSSVFMAIAPAVPTGMYAPPMEQDAPPTDQMALPDAGPDGKTAPPIVHGRPASHGGQELTGEPLGNQHVATAIFKFRNAASAMGDSQGHVGLEFHAPIDHGGDLAANSEDLTDLTFTVRPANSPAGSDDSQQPVDMKLETRMTAYADLPAAAMADGNFDVLVHCNTGGHVVGVDSGAMALVVSTEPFAWNLFKSLFILWMLTVLVVSLAVFSSTFLSWPIALVLTLTLLMGHWCVMQVSDANDKTLGRAIVNDMGLTDASKAEAVVASVNALSGALPVVGSFLPDIDRFTAISSIESGIIVSAADLMEALGVLVSFALPAAVGAYIILKKREVAP